MVGITVPMSMDKIPLVKCANAAAAAAVPTVDLSAPGAAAAVEQACRSVGIFRAINHGVPTALTDALEAGAAAFFALPHKKKLEASANPLGYGSKSIGRNGDVGWLEYILLSVGSGPVAAASLPPSLRAALEEYTDAVREVGARVLELMAEGLGLAEENRGVLRRVVASDEADDIVRVNHYPPWPCPLAAGQRGRGVTGFGEHTDPQVISLLRSNRTAGLQIMLPDGRWVPVAPDPDSLFVNVGDSLRVGADQRAVPQREAPGGGAGGGGAVAAVGDLLRRARADAADRAAAGADAGRGAEHVQGLHLGRVQESRLQVPPRRQPPRPLRALPLRRPRLQQQRRPAAGAGATSRGTSALARSAGVVY
ncbi:hypothetical protein VPH35_011243 [Triticum aestivum]